MSPYPILVERFPTKAAALTIACEACHAEEVITADDIRNEQNYSCPKGCGGWASYKYEEADKCGGCGELGFYRSALDYCCSRRCQLQKEYATELAKRKATA